ncbi:2,3-bisphosphoglycerate-independent phosphoglycerate mutase [Marivivens donghaensis]|uniref:2,3-bisphosphoglycerate-independent phosphoglycerate mutase n=1 Tax=Marivivens donghaensis TaxID=1699413 RepID=UPI00201F2698|nr:2,3-bisphosphoglycerate-independent phosphoglycerate mutase [Marivivens donghaensis]MCL7409515.1 2,3-bisphosphoglycerate-independent phosphoglycerate mutase [Marivivens donghaensis]MDN3702994.1 2,3-bisphosphoglycerate-independent phosphoglycerate mutase [Marivivens donghaensis]
MTRPKPVVLCILDGWGNRPDATANAPALADTPTFDRIIATCPTAELITHGPDVGLPSGQMGNSEVGHTNIGAGRVVAMDLGQIDLSIEDGSFGKTEGILAFITKLKETGGQAHLMGVVSDGGVHGHIEHIIAAAKVLTDAGLPVALHAITDGRDVAPKSADVFMADLLARLPEGCTVASVTGRYFAMDRDNRWERVSTAYHAMIDAKGAFTAPDAATAVANAFARGETDEFIQATVIEGYTGVQSGDGLFCLNFRADRAREILAAMAQPDFSGFDRGALPPFAARLGMVEYSVDHNAWFETVFPKRKIVNTLGEWVAKQGLTQFRLAETEKYPHVTFFLNGGKETPEVGEDRFMPLSPKVATYDLQPEMSAPEVTAKFVEAIEQGYDLIVTNYANPDMVGHTGDLQAAMKACEAVDQGLAKVVEALEKAGGAMVITADHGNCEMMIDPETGGAHTAHTLNPVPVAVFGGPKGVTLRNGRLADLAPTLLDLMELPQPDEMTGQSLLIR